MRQPKTKVNGIAMLKNVTAVTEAMEHAVNRPSYLPGLVVFSGASGLGKTSSAIWMANEMRAYHVEMDSSCTRKELLLDILSEMGIHAPGRTHPRDETPDRRGTGPVAPAADHRRRPVCRPARHDRADPRHPQEIR